MQKDLDFLITKILSNDATAEEKDYFDKWLHSDESHFAEFVKIKSYWKSQVNSEYDASAAYERFKDNKLNQKINKKTRHLVLGMISAAAAVALLFITLGKVLNPPVRNFTFTTQNEKDTLLLPDSTQIILNKHSRLDYSSLYGKNDRHVKLVGEGYFDVRKNPRSPFIVEMKKSRITVLGTAFNVRAYESDDCVKATLVRGSIRFNIDEDQVTLKPNQELDYNKFNEEISIKSVEVSASLLWLKDIYKYQSTSLQYLLNNLGAVYGKKIVITNKELASTILSGSFQEKQPLDEILRIISRSVPIKWETKDNTIIIHTI